MEPRYWAKMDPRDLPDTVKHVLVCRMADCLLEYDSGEIGGITARIIAYTWLFEPVTAGEAEAFVLQTRND